METRKILAILVLALLGICWQGKASEAGTLGTAFTYQGHLYDANHVANGLYDLQFKLYDADSDGNQVGGDVNKPDVDVIDGYFTVELDFGNVFDGNAVWLKIGVRPGELEEPNVYTTLSPRQGVTPTPYAIYAKTAGAVSGGMGGSGTANYLAKFTSGNTLGDSIIYENAGKVGIGTTSPDNTLEVCDGSVLFSLGEWENAFRVQALDTTIFRVDTDAYASYFENGNVGIGTTGPAYKLDVSGDIRATGTIYGNVDNADKVDGYHYNSTWPTTLANIQGACSNDFHNIGGTDDDVPDSDGEVPDNISINNGRLYAPSGSGNVGIGITTPDEKLTVDGTIKSTTSAADGRAVYAEASNSGDVTNYGGYFSAAGGTGKGIWGEASQTGDFVNHGGYFTAAGTYGRGVFGYATGTYGRGVDGYASNSGDVTNYGGYFRASGSDGRGVYGYASNIGDYYNYGGYFEAAGRYGRGVYGKSSGSWGEGVYGVATGTNGMGVYGLASNTGSVVNYGGYFEAYGTGGRAVAGWGQLYDFWAAGPGTDYGSASSIRWKRDIRPIDDPLGKILRLRGVYFNWDEEHGGEHDVGMIAEEVGEVLPEIVEYEPDGKYTSGMDYSKLTPLLVEAVKALKIEADEREKQHAEKDAIIERLQEENRMLSKRVAAIEEMVGTAHPTSQRKGLNDEAF